MQETWILSLDWEDPLEKGKTAHSSVLAWRIPWPFFLTWRCIPFAPCPHMIFPQYVSIPNVSLCTNLLSLLLFFNINLFILIRGQLLYNIVLVLPYINMNLPRVYMCSPSWTPLPPPTPYHPSGSSQCTSPKHPVSWIEPGLVIHFIYDITHVSMPFCQIIPPFPSPTESKRLFYTSVSLLLSRIQSYCYHLSKFHIYALVYSIGVFLY